ncbi:hypothetical protein KNO81_40680 [Paraburkholderia sediminicola]|nr:hypothetical protein [Paraburkholderia sediminicola]
MTARDILRAERRATIRQCAFQLADSGGHADWQAIEPVLCLRYGLLETRRLLADLRLRGELNWHCLAAGRRHRAAAG